MKIYFSASLQSYNVPLTLQCQQFRNPHPKSRGQIVSVATYGTRFLWIRILRIIGFVIIKMQKLHLGYPTREAKHIDLMYPMNQWMNPQGKHLSNFHASGVSG